MSCCIYCQYIQYNVNALCQGVVVFFLVGGGNGFFFFELTQQRRAIKPHKDFDGGELLLEYGLVELLGKNQRLWEETDAQRNAVTTGTTVFCPAQMTTPSPRRISPPTKGEEKKK